MKAKIKYWYCGGLDVWVSQYECDYNGEHIKSDTFSDEDKDDVIDKSVEELKIKYGICDYELVED